MELLQLQGVTVLVIHDVAQIERQPRLPKVRVIVSGLSHKPSMMERDGVIFINPGSAGPRRFKLPVSVGELTIHGSSVTARNVELLAASLPATSRDT